MGHDPARAATVGALALLLLVTASLFPAGGFGSYPAADRAEPVEGGLDQNTPTRVTTASASPTRTPVERSQTATETPTPTDRATDTPTDTPTPTPANDEDDTDGSIPFVGLFGGFGLAILAVAMVLFSGGVVAVAGRTVARTELPDGRLPRVRLFLAAIPRATVVVLVGSGRLFATVGGISADGLRSLTTGGVRGITATAEAIGTVAVGVGHTLTSLSTPSVGSLVSGVSISRPRHDGDDSQTHSTPAERGGESDTDSVVSPPETVREAWARFPAQVPRLADSPETRTPGELARRAVAAGLPREAVETLTDAFRRVRYADGVDDRRENAALDAFDRLRGSDGDSEDGGGAS